MLVLGLTGNIGSGKSTACRALAEMGVPVLDSDKVGHYALSPCCVAQEAVKEAFGEVFVGEDGVLDRKMLGKYVFSDTTGYLREKLNDLTHPLIQEHIEKWLEEQKAAGAPVAVVESALLIRTGLNDMVDKIWVIKAPREEMIRRAMERDGSYETSVSMRLNAQMPQDEMAGFADLVLENDKTEEEFAELLEFLEKVKFDRVGVFAYSCEEGTPAARMKDQLPAAVKEERRDKVMELCQKISFSRNESLIGKTFTVITEGFEDNLYYGRSEGESIEIDPKIYFGAHRELSAGDFVDVVIKSVDEYDLCGEEIERTV